MQEVYCPICAEGYFFVRPRVLLCGHSICENCLKQTIEKQQLNCFYCKKPLVQNGKIACPVNYGLQSLVRRMINTKQGILFSRENFLQLTLSYRERIREQMREKEEKRRQNQLLLSDRQILIVDLQAEETTIPTASMDFRDDVPTSASSERQQPLKIKRIRKRKTF